MTGRPGLKRAMRQRVKRLVLGVLIARLNGRNRFARAPLTRPGGPVVSLTTFGQRLRSVYLAIESIGCGTLLPSRLILWLDEPEALRNPPLELRRLQARGLQIAACENLAPHKKYYPFVESEPRFDVPLVTADDDILYPRLWLESLVAAWAQGGRLINCYRARVARLNADGFERYERWDLCRSTEPSALNMATGASGVIYPPGFLLDLKAAGRAFLSCCPRADDLWLHVNALRSGYRVRQIRRRPLHFLAIPDTQEAGLLQTNLAGGNDGQIRATYTPADIEMLRTEAGASAGAA